MSDRGLEYYTEGGILEWAVGRVANSHQLDPL